MRKKRFEVKTLRGEWKYLFANIENGTNKETGTSLMPTDHKFRAYVSHSPEKDLEYYRSKGGNNNVRFAR